jgi:tape measure domain-containing protein
MTLQIETVSDSRHARDDLQKLRTSVDGIQQSASKVASSIRTATAAIAGMVAVSASLSANAKVLDKYTKLRNQLGLVTRSTNEMNAALNATKQIALDTGAKLDAVAGLYQKAGIAAQRFGVSQARIASFTKAVSQSLALSGATVGETQSALLQLGQGLTSNRLAGEELRAMFESAPVFIQALAKGMNREIGEIRSMAEAGLLSFSTVFNAINSQADDLNKKFKDFGITYAKAFSNIGLAFSTLFNSTVELFLGAESKIPAVINNFARSIFDFANNLKVYSLQAEIYIYSISQRVEYFVGIASNTIRKLIGASGQLQHVVSRIFNQIKYTIVSIAKAFPLSDLVGFFNKAALQILSVFDGIRARISVLNFAIFEDTFRAIIDGFWQVMRSMPEIDVMAFIPGLDKALAVVLNFAEKAERAFFWLYDKVIGNSWIPDLVEGVEGWTKKLVGKSLDSVKRFTGESDAAFYALSAGGLSAVGYGLFEAGKAMYGLLRGVRAANFVLRGLGLKIAAIVSGISLLGGTGYLLSGSTLFEAIDFNTVSKKFVQWRESIDGLFSSLGTNLKSSWDAIFGTLETISQNAADALSDAFALAGVAASQAWEWITTKSTQMRDAIANSASYLMSGTAEDPRGIFQKAGDAVSKLMNGVLITGISWAIVAAVSSERVRTAFLSIFTLTIGLGITAAFKNEGVFGAIAELAAKFVSSISEGISNFAASDPLRFASVLVGISLLLKTTRALWAKTIVELTKVPARVAVTSGLRAKNGVLKLEAASLGKDIRRLETSLQKQTDIAARNLLAAKQAAARTNNTNPALRAALGIGGTRTLTVRDIDKALADSGIRRQLDFNSRVAIRKADKNIKLVEEGAALGKAQISALKQSRSDFLRQSAVINRHFENLRSVFQRSMMGLMGTIGGAAGGAVGFMAADEYLSVNMPFLDDFHKVGLQIAAGFVAGALGSALSGGLSAIFWTSLKGVFLRLIPAMFMASFQGKIVTAAVIGLGTLIGAAFSDEVRTKLKNLASSIYEVFTSAHEEPEAKRLNTAIKANRNEINALETSRSGATPEEQTAIQKKIFELIEKEISLRKEFQEYADSRSIGAQILRGDLDQDFSISGSSATTAAVKYGLEEGGLTEEAKERYSLLSDRLSELADKLTTLGVSVSPSAVNDIARDSSIRKAIEKAVQIARTDAGTVPENREEILKGIESVLSAREAAIKLDGRARGESYSLVRDAAKQLREAAENIKETARRDRMNKRIFEALESRDWLKPGVPAFATGGYVSGRGTGTSDSIPAKLSNGEFVVNAAVTKKLGWLLRYINAGNTDLYAIMGAISGYLRGAFKQKNGVNDAMKLLPDSVGESYIKAKEGFVPRVYQDSQGFLTTGVGHLLSTTALANAPFEVNPKGSGATAPNESGAYPHDKFLRSHNYKVYSASRLNSLFKEDYDKYLGIARRDLSNFADLHKFAKLAMVDHAFQVGSIRWPRLRAAMLEQDYFSAAREVLDSKGAKQAPGRFQSRAKLLELAGKEVQRFATGGYVSGPGTGTSDSIPAMISNGEFVVNASATSKFKPLLEHLNAGRVGHFSQGSGVASSDSAIPVVVENAKDLTASLKEFWGDSLDYFPDVKGIFTDIVDYYNPPEGTLRGDWNAAGDDGKALLLLEELLPAFKEGLLKDPVYGTNLAPDLNTFREMSTGARDAVFRSIQQISSSQEKLEEARANGTSSKKLEEIISKAYANISNTLTAADSFDTSPINDVILPRSAKGIFDDLIKAVPDLRQSFLDFSKLPAEVQISLAGAVTNTISAQSELEGYTIRSVAALDAAIARAEANLATMPADASDEVIEAAKAEVERAKANKVAALSSTALQKRTEEFTASLRATEDNVRRAAFQNNAYSKSAKLVLDSLQIDSSLLKYVSDSDIERLVELGQAFEESQVAYTRALEDGSSNRLKLAKTADTSEAELRSFIDTISSLEPVAKALGKSFAENTKASFSSSLTDLLSGKSSFKDASKALLDSFTMSVLETFSKGLTESLFKGLMPDIESFGTNIAKLLMPSTKESDGKAAKSPEATGEAAAEGLLGAVHAKVQEGTGGIADLFGEGGLLGMIKKGLSGIGDMFGGLFSSIGSLFSGSGGFNFGSILGFFGGFFANGGLIRGAGTGTSDNILAAVSNGEYVVNAASTRRFLPMLEAINAGRAQRFAKGGLVGHSAPQINDSVSQLNSVSQNSAASQQVINLTITGDISRQTKSEIYKMLPNIAQGVNQYNANKGYTRGEK